jgi:hypothetical protein
MISLITPFAELYSPISGQIFAVKTTGIPIYKWMVFSSPKNTSSGNFAAAAGIL